MKFNRILFATVCCFHLISCQNGVDEKRDAKQEEKAIPLKEHKKMEKSFPELKTQTPKKQDEKEEEKKRLKTIDTLKPITAKP